MEPEEGKGDPKPVSEGASVGTEEQPEVRQETSEMTDETTKQQEDVKEVVEAVKDVEGESKTEGVVITTEQEGRETDEMNDETNDGGKAQVEQDTEVVVDERKDEYEVVAETLKGEELDGFFNEVLRNLKSMNHSTITTNERILLNCLKEATLRVGEMTEIEKLTKFHDKYVVEFMETLFTNDEAFAFDNFDVIRCFIRYCFYIVVEGNYILDVYEKEQKVDDKRNERFIRMAVSLGNMFSSESIDRVTLNLYDFDDICQRENVGADCDKLNESTREHPNINFLLPLACFRTGVVFELLDFLERPLFLKPATFIKVYLTLLRALNCHVVIRPSVLDSFLERLFGLYKRVFTDIPLSEFSGVDRETLLILFKKFIQRCGNLTCLSRFGRQIEEIPLLFSKRCLESDFVMMKYLGIYVLSAMKEMAENSKFRFNTWQYLPLCFLTISDFVEFLKDMKFIDVVINPSTNAQIIEASKELVKYILDKSDQSDCRSYMDTIFNTVANSHESVSNAVVPILKNLWHLDDESILYVLSKFRSFELKDYTEPLMNLFCSLLPFNVSGRFFDIVMIPGRLVMFASPEDVEKPQFDIVARGFQSILGDKDFYSKANDVLGMLSRRLFHCKDDSSGDDMSDSEPEMKAYPDKLFSTLESCFQTLVKRQGVYNYDTRQNSYASCAKRILEYIGDDEMNMALIIGSIHRSFVENPSEKSESEVRKSLRMRLDFLYWLYDSAKLYMSYNLVEFIFSCLIDPYVPGHLEEFLEWIPDSISKESTEKFINELVFPLERSKFTPGMFMATTHILVKYSSPSDLQGKSLHVIGGIDKVFDFALDRNYPELADSAENFILSFFTPFGAENINKTAEELNCNLVLSEVREGIVQKDPCHRKGALHILGNLLKRINPSDYFSISPETFAATADSVTVFVDVYNPAKKIVKTFYLVVSQEEKVSSFRAKAMENIRSAGELLTGCNLERTFFVIRSESISGVNQDGRKLKEYGLYPGMIIKAYVPQDTQDEEALLLPTYISDPRESFYYQDLKKPPTSIVSSEPPTKPKEDEKKDEKKESIKTEEIQLQPPPSNAEELLSNLTGFLEDPELLTDPDFIRFVLATTNWDCEKAYEALSNKTTVKEKKKLFEHMKNNPVETPEPEVTVKKVKACDLAMNLSKDSSFFDKLFALCMDKETDQNTLELCWSVLCRIPLYLEYANMLKAGDSRPIEDWLANHLTIDHPYLTHYTLTCMESIIADQVAVKDSADMVDSERLFREDVIDRVINVVLPSLESSMRPELFGVFSSALHVVSYLMDSTDITVKINVLDTISLALNTIAKSTKMTGYEGKLIGFCFNLVHLSIKRGMSPQDILMKLLECGVSQDSSSMSDSEPQTKSPLVQLLLSHPEKSVRESILFGLFPLITSSKSVGDLSSIVFHSLLPLVRIAVSPENEHVCSEFFSFICGMIKYSHFHETFDDNMALLVKDVVPLIMEEIVKRPPIEEFTDLDKQDIALAGMCNFLSRVVDVRSDVVIENCSEPFLEELVKTLFDFRSPEDSRISLPKAKSTATREALTSLLEGLTRSNEQVKQKIIELVGNAVRDEIIPVVLNEEELSKFSSRRGWSYNPRDFIRRQGTHTGLNNTGNICYLNSTMQQLYHIPAFRRAILSIDVNELKCESHEKRHFICALQALFYSLNVSERTSIDPQGFVESFFRSFGRMSEIREQHDASEFLTLLIDELDKALKGTSYFEEIKNIFYFTLVDQIKSREEAKPYLSENTSESLLLSLDIHGNKSLANSLDKFIIPDTLCGENAYNTEQWGKVDIDKRAMLQKLGPYVLVHFKRVVYDFGEDKQVKYNELVSFNHLMDFTPWTKDFISGSTSSLSGSLSSSSLSADKPKNTYRLRGIVIHSGAPTSGHYYSFISKDKDCSSWLRFNDSAVSPMSVSDIDPESFGGTKKEKVYDNYYRYWKDVESDRINNAYILVYESTDVEPEETTEMDQDIKAKYPNLLNNPLVQESDKMNLVSRMEVCTFNTGFLQFLLGILESKPDLLPVEMQFNIFMNMVCRTKDGTLHQLPWSNHIANLLKQSGDACVAQKVLCSMGSSEFLRENLYVSNIETSRIATEHVISAAMSLAAPLEWDKWMSFTKKDPSKEELQTMPMLNLLLSTISLLAPCRNYWKKLRQYFKIFVDFVEAGKAQARRFLLNKKGFSQTINNWFFKQKEFTVSVMDHEYAPDLVHYVKLVSLLVRGCYQGPDNKGVTPYSLDTSVYGELLELPPNWKRLMLGKFGQEIVRYHYNIGEAELMMCHLCYNDPQVSTFFLQNLLEERREWKEVSNCYHALLALCRIQDEHNLPALRLRYILCNCEWGNRVCVKKGLFYTLQRISSLPASSIYYTVKFLEDLCNLDSTTFAYIFYRRQECCSLLPVLCGMYIQCAAETTQEKMSIANNYITTKQLPAPPSNSDRPHFRQLCLYLAMQSAERIRKMILDHLDESCSDLVVGETFEIMETETTLLETALENAKAHIPQILVPEWIKNSNGVSESFGMDSRSAQTIDSKSDLESDFDIPDENEDNDPTSFAPANVNALTTMADVGKW